MKEQKDAGKWQQLTKGTQTIIKLPEAFLFVSDNFTTEVMGCSKTFSLNGDKWVAVGVLLASEVLSNDC